MKDNVNKKHGLNQTSAVSNNQTQPPGSSEIPPTSSFQQLRSTSTCPTNAVARSVAIANTSSSDNRSLQIIQPQYHKSTVQQKQFASRQSATDIHGKSIKISLGTSATSVSQDTATKKPPQVNKTRQMTSSGPITHDVHLAASNNKQPDQLPYNPLFTPDNENQGTQIQLPNNILRNSNQLCPSNSAHSLQTFSNNLWGPDCHDQCLPKPHLPVNTTQPCASPRLHSAAASDHQINSPPASQNQQASSLDSSLNMSNWDNYQIMDISSNTHVNNQSHLESSSGTTSLGLGVSYSLGPSTPRMDSTANGSLGLDVSYTSTPLHLTSQDNHRDLENPIQAELCVQCTLYEKELAITKEKYDSLLRQCQAGKFKPRYYHDFLFYESLVFYP